MLLCIRLRCTQSSIKQPSGSITNSKPKPVNLAFQMLVKLSLWQSRLCDRLRPAYTYSCNKVFNVQPDKQVMLTSRQKLMVASQTPYFNGASGKALTGCPPKRQSDRISRIHATTYQGSIEQRPTRSWAPAVRQVIEETLSEDDADGSPILFEFAGSGNRL